MTKETSKTKTANLKLITAGVIVVSVLAERRSQLGEPQLGRR